MFYKFYMHFLVVVQRFEHFYVIALYKFKYYYYIACIQQVYIYRPYLSTPDPAILFVQDFSSDFSSDFFVLAVFVLFIRGTAYCRCLLRGLSFGHVLEHVPKEEPLIVIQTSTMRGQWCRRYLLLLEVCARKGHC